MKFVIESGTRGAARLGSLSEFERLPNAIQETPLLLLYTKRGSVPHITKEVLEMLTAEQQLLTFSLPTTFNMTEAAKQWESIGHFVGLKEYPTFMTIQDPAACTARGHNVKDTVSIQTQRGRVALNPDQYMDIVETFKPDLYVALCDGDTDSSSSEKRITKSVERSKSMLERCLDRHNMSESVKGKGILGAIVGGYNIAARERSIKNLEGKPLAGYVFDGLHNNGPEVDKITLEQIGNIIKHTISLLPPDKVRIVMGSWNPAIVMDLVELGVDVFDSSYPYLITERSGALTFLNDQDNSPNDDSSNVIYLAEERYAEDLTPLCESCKCLTCQNHTRAYLHHLHHTKELLGPVLLMIHNTHHYIQFFKAIRDSLRNDTFPDLKAKIHSRFPANR